MPTGKGASSESVLGDASRQVGGSSADGGGGASTTTVGGTLDVVVTNSEGEDIGYRLSVTGGELQVHSVSGEVVVTSGASPGASLVKVRVRPTGSVQVEHVAGAKVDLNATGAKLSTPGGEVSLDLVGNVGLGPAGKGSVVTTLTHPVDFVTGAPIQGTTAVSAGGLVGTAPVPSTFVGS